MAGPNPSQSTSMQSDGSELDKHLEEAYNMPPSQWWDSVRQAFMQLQYLSRSRSGVAVDHDIDQPADEYAVSARLARAASLPAIVLLPSGNHALGLTATNEALQCVAFGTAGRKMFVELLWEAIAQAQNNGTAKVVVHEVLQGEIPQITLRVESHLFELRYFQCEPLVRTYPNILDAPISFLEDRNSCSVALQQEVAKLQQGHRLDEKFNTNPDYRRAYYYKRAWAIAWGLFDSDKDAQRVFELCDNTSLDCNEDFSSIISKFVELWGLHYPQELKYRTNHWHQLLSQIEVEPLHRKLDYPYYLQVTVLYTGPSSMMGGEWLSMVERRLEWLKTNLNALVLTPRQAFGSGQRFRIWPERLVRRHATPGDGVYEGCFLLGLDIEKSLLSTVMQVAERWKLGIIDDDLTSKGQCFLDVIMIHDKSELENLDLKTCTKNWPRPITKSEEGSRESHSLKLSKRERKELSREQKSHGDAPAEVSKSTNKLRPASDVLNRLRYGGEYDIDEFVVGYKDRHSSRLMEKPAVQWARDTTDDEFIPEHRIEYFKRYNQQGDEEIFWDKGARLDKIFQHRGSG